MSIHHLRASRQQPCRVCGRGNQRCLNYGNGGTLCMVHDSPEAKRVDCGAVGTGFYYAPNPIKPLNLTSPRPALPVSKPAPAMADLDTRDRVYRDILARFPLSDEHREHLTGPTRQLPMEGLSLFGSLPASPEERRMRCHGMNIPPGVPGAFIQGLAGPSGFMVPYQLPDGRIQGFQIRADSPKNGKYVWFSSSGFNGGTPSGTFIHYTHNQPRLDVWVCEGALKATVAASKTDEMFIGLPGCHLSDVEALLCPLQLTPRLILCPDADYRTNPEVWKAWKRNIERLTLAGLEVRVATWEPGMGKGIDDFIQDLRTEQLSQVRSAVGATI